MVIRVLSKLEFVITNSNLNHNILPLLFLNIKTDAVKKISPLTLVFFSASVFIEGNYLIFSTFVILFKTFSFCGLLIKEICMPKLALSMFVWYGE